MHTGISAPGKIIAVGLNYRSHAAELGMPVPDEPLLFMKPPSAVIGAGDYILIPKQSGRVDYEGELALAIGRKCRNVSQFEADEYIRGYCCANDVTARDLQERDGQWTRAKGFDSFCPLGPWLVTAAPDPESQVELFVNDERRQSAPIADMIFSPVQLVAFISAVMTLEPGDIILTGTPPGVGRLKAGDQVTVRIEGIGELANPVVSG